MNLRDRVVVITGAGSGIGRATALAFAAEGARVAACDVDEARLEALAAELGDRKLLVRKVDVSDRLAMKLFADAVHELAPAADVVVNNAGVAVGGTFLETSLDDWDWLLGVNLRGVVHGCHYFIPKMVERGAGGHVVNVSSILGIYPAAGVSAYVASKFAVRGLSLSLRTELAPHKIGVTAICPGMIATQIVSDGRMAGQVAARKSKVAATFRDRGAPPSRVASAIVDAVRTNPAVRPVGADAKVIAALTRVAPRALDRLAGSLTRRFGVH
ncbi:MAG TPA: SDR family NAD(P)-dependent oxidoreductase [Kofleriaceae bacterium]|nr:SDR family NAD(P)-dependent oxidoreductase [Kofleriaceae bacterium]